MHKPTTFISAIILATSISQARADTDPASGIWQTESNENGDYLHVNIADCEDKLCGEIVGAFNKENQESENYENLGKLMISNMQKAAPGKYKRGKIWAPDEDKTYKAKMALRDGKLKVSGCVAFICRSQVWQRVK